MDGYDTPVPNSEEGVCVCDEVLSQGWAAGAGGEDVWASGFWAVENSALN